MRPRASLLAGVAEELNRNRVAVSDLPSSPKPLMKKVANKKISPCQRKFLEKLKDERFKEFSKTEWLLYFQYLYKQVNHIVYYVNGQQMYCKHYAIIKSLMKNYEPLDIKAMIDFLFLSDQDLFNKGSITIYHLSAGFLPTVYQNAMLWVRGKYVSKKKNNKEPKRTREWTGESTYSNDEEIMI